MTDSLYAFNDEDIVKAQAEALKQRTKVRERLRDAIDNLDHIEGIVLIVSRTDLQATNLQCAMWALDPDRSPCDIATALVTRAGEAQRRIVRLLGEAVGMVPVSTEES